MVDEGGESASKTLGVDLGELQVAILEAAHAVVVDGTGHVQSVGRVAAEAASSEDSAPAAGWIWP